MTDNHMSQSPGQGVAPTLSKFCSPELGFPAPRPAQESGILDQRMQLSFYVALSFCIASQSKLFAFWQQNLSVRPWFGAMLQASDAPGLKNLDSVVIILLVPPYSV
jgi:hypothetical protein